MDGIFGPLSKQGRASGSGPAPLSAQAPGVDKVIDLAARAWSKRFKEREVAAGAAFWLDLPSNYRQRTDLEPPHDWEPVPEDARLRVAVVRMPLVQLARQGRVPDALTPQVQQFIDLIESRDAEGAADRVMQEFQERPEETYRKWHELLKFVWLNVVVAPGRWVATAAEADPDNLVFSVEDVDYFDLLYVYEYSQGVDREVREFLRFQVAVVGAVGDGNGLRPDAGRAVVIDRSTGRLVGLAGEPGGVEMGPVRQGEDRGDDRGPARPATGSAEGHQAEVQAGADPRHDLRAARGSKGRRRTDRRTGDTPAG